MISIKEAVESAIVFAQATLGPERSIRARLEEVDSITVGDEDAWLITLSMIDQEQPYLDFGKRYYKTFTVLKRSGEVTSMRIRDLANA